MTRYAKQPRGSSVCGPIAILNALKWAGARATLRAHLKEIVEEAGCNQETEGTLLTAFESALRHFGKEQLRVRTVFPWPGIETLEAFLRNSEHAVITGFRWKNKKTGKSDVHHALIVGVSKTGKTLLCVNYDEGKTTVARVRRKEFLLDHAQRKDAGDLGGVSPCLWFLEKIARPCPP